MVDDVHRTRTLDPDDPAYPPALRRLGGRALPGRPRWPRPPTIHVRGVLPPLPLIAIVGTRTPCSPAVAWTHDVVRALGARGWAIGSGGAEGIDDAAHRAAIAAGIPTVVVTVGGLDAGRNSHAATLFPEVLASGGALVSLDGDGKRPVRPDFFRRNHLLAALADALLAVELRPRHGQGGTGHTVRSATALGRPVMTVPHAPWSEGGRATRELARAGVPFVGGVEEIEGVIANFHSPPSARASEREARDERPGDAQHEADGADGPALLSDDARAALAALTPEPTHLDVLCARARLDIVRLQRALLECCLAQRAIEASPGRFASVERVASRRAARETTDADARPGRSAKTEAEQ